jgi:uncharacterized protein (DUF2252 family)
MTGDGRSSRALYDRPVTGADRGKAARAVAPRSAHAAWEPAADRVGPVEILRQQAATRTAQLVPIRHGRMLRSPFAFFRGAAAIMAADLAGTPATGLNVQLCGDAHLANFGVYAAPDRELVFDLNDFDETLPGPWEWDVKRLAASLAIAGRDLGLKHRERREAVLAAMCSYRGAMREFAGMRTLDVWYARLDVAEQFARWGASGDTAARRNADRTLAKARRKDSLRAVAKLTREVDGRLEIVSDPPLIVPLGELLPAAEAERVEEELKRLLRDYARTLQADRRHLFASYRPVEMAHKVVGVGSVGTRTWIVLLLGRDASDPLVLQIKQAQRSVLEPYTRRCRQANQGQRVVDGQRMMQAASDVFLGWLRVKQGIDDGTRDFYVRQLWDAKVSAPIEELDGHQLARYGEVCGWTLARAHARTGDREAIAAYLGKGDRFDTALAAFAETYADQNERDHAALAAAVDAGTLEADLEH